MQVQVTLTFECPDSVEPAHVAAATLDVIKGALTAADGMGSGRLGLLDVEPMRARDVKVTKMETSP